MKQSKGTSICVQAVVLLVLIFCTHIAVDVASARDNTPIAWWKFDKQIDAKKTADAVSRYQDTLIGYTKYVKGVSGTALIFDGYSTGVVRQASNAPELPDAFSFEAWIAIQAYPWDLCGIVDRCEHPDVEPSKRLGNIPPQKDPTAGYIFGIHANGHVNLELFADGKWQKCTSKEKIPLMQWTHIAATYDASKGMAVYINGKKTGSKAVKGPVKFAPKLDMLVGRNNKARVPYRALNTNTPVLYSFDGYIDEVKIYDRALSDEHIRKSYTAAKPGATGMTFRKLPDEPKGPAPFGAYYTQLKFDEAWDAIRHEGPLPDVVVLFDDKPWRFVLWRGTGFVPHWVTENDIWYSNEFNETWGNAEYVAEPMSDKQCRYSHVRIIESTDARVVLHWRYALSDLQYNVVRVDPATGWGDWADEYNVIYPDGVGIRKQNLWSSEIDEYHEFHESMVLSQPGTRPEDNIETKALTLVNMEGETHTYSWLPKAPDKLDKPANPNIQLVNTKSKAKPFLIVSDAPCVIPNSDPVMTMLQETMSSEELEQLGAKYNAMDSEEKEKFSAELLAKAIRLGFDKETKLDGPRFKPYNMWIHREYSNFTWWNHWPVAQIASDGRDATEPDRVAHTSLSNVVVWDDYEVTENTRVRLMMHGLTEKHPIELATLARSWLRAPQLFNRSRGYTNKGYDQAQRAYVFEYHDSEDNEKSIRFELPASDEQPLVNPAFIIKNWGNDDITLQINRQPIERGKALRYGHVRTPQGADLIIWIELEETKHTEIRISHKEE